jgi:hypothetical protein
MIYGLLEPFAMGHSLSFLGIGGNKHTVNEYCELPVFLGLHFKDVICTFHARSFHLLVRVVCATDNVTVQPRRKNGYRIEARPADCRCQESRPNFVGSLA